MRGAARKKKERRLNVALLLRLLRLIELGRATTMKKLTAKSGASRATVNRALADAALLLRVDVVFDVKGQLRDGSYRVNDWGMLSRLDVMRKQASSQRHGVTA